MSIFNKLFKPYHNLNNNQKNKKFDLEILLAADDVNSSIIEIDNFVCELCSWGNGIDKLTEYQKSFYFNQNLEREINNGGFNQYFYNSSGNFAHDTVISLKEINANKTADILQEAINQFPDSIVPKNRDERQTLLEEMGETANDIFETLDQKFFLYEDDLNTLNIDYIRKNKNMF